MICIPISGPSMQKALSDLKQAEPLADIIEFRTDLIDSPDIPRLLEAAHRPGIVTNRTKLEGGQFKGDDEQRIKLLRKAIEAGAEYVDIEVSTPRDLLKSVLENKGNTRIIVSYHNFSQTPESLDQLYEVMCELPADIVKIATYAKDINDNLQIFKLLRRARTEEQKLIALCMGEMGECSRILGPLIGGFLTFGCLDTGKATAPGQIPAQTLRDVYRVHEPRSPGFKIYGVIGNPVSKSMGYLIHNRAFQEIGSDDIYLPFLVNNPGKFFNGFNPWFSGLSVTMPFKEDIRRSLDEVDETAQKIGAVNTVVRTETGWKGYNTDCSGALQALQSRTELKGKKVLILGSGGTAKAIGHGIVEHGGHVTVTYQTNRERGESLARELGGEVVSVRDAGERPIDILINCSPAGMDPKVEETPFPARYFKPGMIVFDSVYNPPETRLLREAKAAGCATISGVEFFINQAVGQFELWTGRQAPADAMRQVLMKKIEEKS